ncbi:MAG: hypothetical protein II328_05615 [Clostridia bacterium]|nr:hypothetical protein [Clostridia bacterium]
MVAREIYLRALALLQEQDADGAGYDTDAFETSAPHLINLLCSLLDDLDLHIKGRRFHESQSEPRTIDTLDDEVLLHPVICAGVLPLGLAFLLISEEDTARAGLFFKLYEQEKDALRRRFKQSRRHRITSVYS